MTRPFGAFFNDVHHDDKDKFYNKLHDMPNNKGNLKRGDDMQFYLYQMPKINQAKPHKIKAFKLKMP